jgi:tetratricopeptide (TPR) repeat protein
MLDVSVFGVNPAAMHLENVLWHAMTTMLLFHVFHRATGRLWPSAIVAGIFGIHPINVESVAWITERKNVTYLAQVGVFFAVVWWIADAVPKHRRALIGWITAVLLGGFAAHTASEVRYWTNSVTLFERAIEQTGPNAFARVLAGQARAEAGDLEAAAEHWKVAVMIQPHLSAVWSDLGHVLTRLGRHAHAVQAFGVAAKQEPQNVEYRLALERASEATSRQGAIFGPGL